MFIDFNDSVALPGCHKVAVGECALEREREVNAEDSFTGVFFFFLSALM